MRPARQSIHHYNRRHHQWQGNHPVNTIITLEEDKATWHLDLKEWQGKWKDLSSCKTSNFQIKEEFWDRQDKHPVIMENLIWALVRVGLRLTAVDSLGMKMEGLIYLTDSSSVVRTEEVRGSKSNGYSTTISWLQCISCRCLEFLIVLSIRVKYSSKKGSCKRGCGPCEMRELRFLFECDVWKRNISTPSHTAIMPMKKGRGVSWQDTTRLTATDKMAELQEQGQGPWRRRQQLVD
jgi:hypothetical protein